MKKLFRSFLINLFSLWIILTSLPGVILEGDLQTLLLLGATLFVISFLIKPVVKIILLPINFLTINFISLVVNFIGLYLLTFIIPQFKITEFQFSGYSQSGLIIPPILLNQFATVAIADIIYTSISNFLHWVSE